ncbi:hypothetical protein ACWIUH_07945 [Ursidibacter arcticus]
MKKILSILSLSFILSGCFDEPKKEMTSTTPEEKSEKTVDSTEKVTTSIENVVEKNQTTEVTSAKDEKTTLVSQNDESKGSTDMTKSEDNAKSENSATATTSEEHQNNKKASITENTPSNKNVEKEENLDSQKTLASTQDAKRSEKNIQRKTSNNDTLSNTSLQTAESRKATTRSNKVAQQDSDISDEEKRVGYQRTLSDAEITYLKSQCRYAFMSEKEVIQYNCATKKVIIK